MKKLFYSVVSLLLIMCSNLTNAQVTKMPLLEEFTSSTCPPCAANNPTFDAMLEANEGSFVCVKYQMNWPGSGDIYYNTDGNTRRNSYSVTGIPELAVDGSVWLTQPAGFLASDLAMEHAQPSDLIIDARFTLDDSILTVFGNLLPQHDITGAIRRYIAVVEKHTYNNTGTNGETEFSYVEQKMLPNGAGIYTTGLTSGASVPFSQTINLNTISHIENKNNLMFAVWVQNSTTKEVLQSTWATFPTGVQEPAVSSSGMISLFPNPASGQTILEYQLQDNAEVSIKIMNAYGQTVQEKFIGQSGFGLHQQILNTNSLIAGVYFVDLTIGNSHYRQPLMIQ